MRCHIFGILWPSLVSVEAWPRDVKTPAMTQMHTADADAEHVRTFRDLATVGAYDDLDEDDEDDDSEHTV